MTAEKPVTRVSTKGQVILPKAVRDQLNWTLGTELSVELTDGGVLLKDARSLPHSKFEDVRGMLKYDGPPRTIEDMNAAISREVKRRHARGRY